MPSGKNIPDFYDQPPGVGKLLIPSDCFFLKNLFPPGRGDYAVLTERQSQSVQKFYQYLTFKTEDVPYLIYMLVTSNNWLVVVLDLAVPSD